MIKINQNVLSSDLSPYLKQHKDNPVNWQTWCKDSLEFAKQNKKPTGTPIKKGGSRKKYRQRRKRRTKKRALKKKH